MWARAINIAIGIWLMAAPDVLRYGGVPADHGRIVGPVIASLACIAMWEVTRSLRWINLLIGLWMLLAPWVLGFPADATINTMLCGAAVAGLSLVRGKLTHRFDGGWTFWRSPAPAPPPQQRARDGG